MIEAKLMINVSSKAIAKSLVEAVSPDNLNMHGLTVRPRVGPKSASFQIQFDGKIETFISTLDDLLRCLQAAQDTLNKISVK